MATLTWTPLELWRASSLPSDTQKATAAYEEALRSGDATAIAALRESIEDRVDALDAFYIVNMDDNRAKLFKKQRLKLRKLLHKTPANVAGGSGGGGGVGSTPRETARLTLAEMLVWYLDQGSKELPWLTEDAVQTMFKRHAAEAKDGRMSLEELRASIATQAPPQTPARGGGGDASGAGAGSGSASGARGGRTPATANGGRADDVGSVSSLGSASVGTSTTAARRRRKARAIYAWEKQQDSESSDDEDGLGLDSLVELKGGVTEFQIRMTAAEYAQYACKRRARAAEKKHMARASLPRPKQLERPEEKTLLQTGPYVEPRTLANIFYRSSRREKWLTQNGFQRSPAPMKGVRPTVATVKRSVV